MPFCKVHIRRLSDKIPPVSGGNGVFLVDAVGVRSVSGEPDECEICHTMTMDGYILKLDGMDTVSTGNAVLFSLIIRTCRKCGLNLINNFLPQ
jgi:hypothetical protein